ncbi:hypothetical protein Hanom_Chr07g00610081 [Helianthus anomalus]
MILAVHCSYYIKSNRPWLSSYFMAHYLQTSSRRLSDVFFLPFPLSRDSRALVSPLPHKTPCVQSQFQIQRNPRFHQPSIVPSASV